MTSGSLPFLGDIATQGVLGLLLALSLFVNWYFIKTVQDLQEKRVNDARETTDKVIEVLDTVRNNTVTLINLFQNFLNQYGK